jgi:hypothetical protein
MTFTLLLGCEVSGLSPCSESKGGGEIPNPTPKASPLVPKMPLSRWDEGGFVNGYRPLDFSSRSTGGFPPPHHAPRAGMPSMPSLRGLQYEPSAKLSVHAPSFASQLYKHQGPDGDHSARSGHKSALWGESLSLLLDIPTNVVKASASDSTTMLALHHQLKDQHHREWLSVLSTAGPK